MLYFLVRIDVSNISSKTNSFLLLFYWHARHNVIKLFLQKKSGSHVFMKHQVSLVGGHHGDLTRLIAVEMIFPIASGTYFYVGKVGTCEFSKRLFSEMQTSVSGFLFLLKESK